MKLPIQGMALFCLLAATACGAPPDGGPEEQAPLDTTLQELPCSTCEPVGDPPPPIVVHGYEINLPLLRPDMMPAGWCYWALDQYGGKFAPCTGANRATMDWRGGNAVFNATYNSWYDSYSLYYGRVDVRVDAVDGFVPIAQTLGYYQHPQDVPGLVRGSVELLIPNQPGIPSPAQSEVLLSLQRQDGATWVDLATSRISITNLRQMHELQALVLPNQNVRFQVSVKGRPDHQNTYFLWKVRMFGAQCYPDFANGGGCL